MLRWLPQNDGYNPLIFPQEFLMCILISHLFYAMCFKEMASKHSEFQTVVYLRKKCKDIHLKSRWFPIIHAGVHQLSDWSLSCWPTWQPAAFITRKWKDFLHCVRLPTYNGQGKQKIRNAEHVRGRYLYPKHFNKDSRWQWWLLSKQNLYQLVHNQTKHTYLDKGPSYPKLNKDGRWQWWLSCVKMYNNVCLNKLKFNAFT